MKKLMIAAALAAVSVGAYADDDDPINAVYDVKFSVKTTTGKEGKTSKSDYYYYGKSQDLNQWWYANDEFRDDGKWDLKVYNDKGDVVAKLLKTYAVASDPGAKQIDQKVLDKYFAPEDQAALFADLEAYLVPKTSKFCMRLKQTFPAYCYRTAASKSLKCYGVAEYCCEDGAFPALKLIDLAKVGGEWEETDLGAITWTLGYRIAGVQKKALGVELFGTATADNDGLVDPVKRFASFEDDSLYLAGQGKVDSYGLVKSVSGNVVGVLANSVCPAKCCDNDEAVAFTCEGGIPETMDGTACYGTFSIKYNSSKTKTYNALMALDEE